MSRRQRERERQALAREQWIADQLRTERIETVACVAGCLLAFSSVFWVPWLMLLIVR